MIPHKSKTTVPFVFPLKKGSVDYELIIGEDEGEIITFSIQLWDELPP